MWGRGRFHVPGCSAARRRVASPPPPLHYVPCLSVCSVSCLSVAALSGQFICQAVNGFVVGQDGTDMLLKQCRKPQAHTIYLKKLKKTLVNLRFHFMDP